MKYTKMGKTGIKVSRLSLGTGSFGGTTDEKTAAKIIRKAVDVGVNVFDSADIYADGRSEEVLGRALKGRGDVMVATKVGGVRHGLAVTPDLSREHVRERAERSLRSLGKDCIDIYYCHMFDPKTPLEETLGTMKDLVAEGKVRYFGLANFSVPQLTKAAAICEGLDLDLDVVQNVYNVLRPEHQIGVLPWAHKRGLAAFTYRPLQWGLLSGKYEEGAPPPKGSKASHRPDYFDLVGGKKNMEAVEEVREVARGAGLKMVELAIAWVLKNPDVTAPIVGASTLRQFEQTCGVTELAVPKKYLTRLDRISKRFLEGPSK